MYRPLRAVLSMYMLIHVVLHVIYSHDESAIKPLKRRKLPSYLNPAIPPKPESQTPWLDDRYYVTNIS